MKRKNYPIKKPLSVPVGLVPLDSGVTIAIEAARELHYEVKPSAKRWIRAEIGKGAKAGTVLTDEDAKKVASALIAAGIAASEPKRHVGVAAVKLGWKKHIAAPGNCPPHRCFFRTIISRENELAKTLRGYTTLVNTGVDT